MCSKLCHIRLMFSRFTLFIYIYIIEIHHSTVLIISQFDWRDSSDCGAYRYIWCGRQVNYCFSQSNILPLYTFSESQILPWRFSLYFWLIETHVASKCFFFGFLLSSYTHGLSATDLFFPESTGSKTHCYINTPYFFSELLPFAYQLANKYS